MLLEKNNIDALRIKNEGINFKQIKMKAKFLLIIISVVLYSCASVIAPTGGKRDNIAPKLKSSYPLSQAMNYKEQKISLEFDEYITIDNLQQKLLITPTPEGNYTTKIMPTGLQLNFEKPFKENITYSLNFRDAIKDASEGNIAKNIKIVFSTGQNIDSLSISGNIKDQNSNKNILDAQVGLYKYTDTINIKKDKPYYFIKTDSSGNYKLENIKQGKYRLITLIDQNSNLLYNPENEKIGYLTEPIEIDNNIKDKNIEVFQADGVSQKVLKTRNSVNYFYIDYAKGIKEVNVKFKKDSLVYMLSAAKTLKFFNVNQTNDTINVKIEVKDSLDNIFSHEQKVRFRNPTKKEAIKEGFEINILPEEGTEISNNLVVELKFSKPILKIDLTKIKAIEDTLVIKTLSEKEIVWNDNRTKLSIKKNLNSKRETKLKIEKGAFESIEKDTSKTIIIDYKLRDIENYGSISGEVKNLKPNEGTIIQLIEKDSKKVVQEMINVTKYQFEWVKAGTYLIRVIVDSNKNQRWDPGKPEKYSQPERIVYYQDEVILKSNFELIGNDIEL
jgi:hypothetical protein